MGSVVFIIMLFLIILALIVSLSVGLGYILVSLIPGLSINVAVLSGTICILGSMFFWTRMISSINQFSENAGIEIEYPNIDIVFPHNFTGGYRKKKKNRA